MGNKQSLVLTGGLLAALAGGMLGVGNGQPARFEQPPAAQGKDAPKADVDKGREADREAIRQSSQAFAQAFAKGDARAAASFWTEHGEYQDDGGAVLRGRAAIEKEYADFYKANPKSTIEVEIRAIRFLGRDTAIEEGILRWKPAGPELPSSTRYSALHVREDGRWKIARVRESGADEDKLEDIAWLIGTWTARARDREVHMTFEWNAKKTHIRNRFSATEGGKITASGTQTIALDPQTGHIRSWMFDDEGGHGQSLWFRDGNRWVMDALGVLPNGRETSATNILTRLNDDAFLWRSTHRTIDMNEVADADPVKIIRVKADK